MSTPTFELDRPAAAFIATLEVDSPMMQAPELRWHWSCLRRRRAHWGLRKPSGPPGACGVFGYKSDKDLGSYAA
jgi:hypothetical protein